jgi:hypothetical protein
MTNPLIPFLIRHGLAGALAGWLFVGALLGLDVSGLGTLVFGAPDWWLPLGLLLFGVSVTFGSLAMGAGIMGLGRPPGPGLGVRLRALSLRISEPRPRPLRVRV